MANFSSAFNRGTELLFMLNVLSWIGSVLILNLLPFTKNIAKNFYKSSFPSIIRSDSYVANTLSNKTNLIGPLFII